MKIQGAIFDMDGTLVESMEMWRSLRERYVRYMGKEPEPNLDHKLATEIGWDKADQYLRDTYGVGIGVENIYEEIKKVIVAPYYQNDVQIIPGMLDFLERLDKAGVKMNLASHTDLWLCEIVMERFGIRKYFKELFTAPELNTNKKFPLMYQLAHKSLGTPKEETWIFEDASYALETAKEEGFPRVGIYDVTEPYPEKVEELGDIYIHDYTEKALEELFA